MTARWDEMARRTGMRFCRAVRSGDEMKIEKARREMRRVLMDVPEEIFRGK